MAMNNVEFERQFTKATQRGDKFLTHEPRAAGVRYDRRTRKVVLELNNGCTLLVPPELAEGLRGASPTDLTGAQILGPGTTVSWPKLDVQFSVAGLLAGIFGTRTWMAEIGRAGGHARSLAKSRASRRNGAKGGRPRKTRIKGRA